MITAAYCLLYPAQPEVVWVPTVPFHNCALLITPGDTGTSGMSLFNSSARSHRITTKSEVRQRRARMKYKIGSITALGVKLL